MLLESTLKLLKSLRIGFIPSGKRPALTFAPQLNCLSLEEGIPTKKWSFRPYGEGLEERCVLANIDFIGSQVNQLWSTPDNWQGGVVPGPVDTAVFNANSPAESVVDIAFAGTILGLVMDEDFNGRIFVERPLTATSVEQSAGSLTANTIGGTAGLTLAAGGVYNWNGGAIEGASVGKLAVSLPVNTIMNIGGGNAHSLLGGTIISSGVIRFKNGTLTIDQGGRIKNHSGSVFFIENTAGNILGGATSMIELTQATMNKSTDALNEIHVSFLNDRSTVNVLVRELHIHGPLTALDGTFDVTGVLSTWDADFIGNNTVRGANGIWWSEETGQLNVASGSLMVSTWSFRLLGDLTGPGLFDFQGTNFWWNGDMEGTGATTIRQGSTLWIESFLPLTPSATDRTINNNGVANWVESNLPMPNAVFNNGLTGVFDVRSDESMTGGTFNNFGVFKKTAGGGTTTIATTFNQSGILEFRNGKLYFTDDLIQTSGQSRFLGGSLDVWGSFTISIGSSVTGEGGHWISIAAWDVINSGTIVVSESGNGAALHENRRSRGI
ncbi:MAG: hypothetical protein L0215_17050 [Gemmataceae bacterium]|nr:hypothetical protein [Gemmataceae bacterium]